MHLGSLRPACAANRSRALERHRVQYFSRQVPLLLPMMCWGDYSGIVYSLTSHTKAKPTPKCGAPQNRCYEAKGLVA